MAATVGGVPAGTLIQARAVEVEIDDVSRFEAGPVQDFVSVGDTTNLVYGLPADTVGEGRRVRFQLIQHGAAAAAVTQGSAKVFFWR
ncbi:hypothetical protein [Actinomadura sp. KC06]|uniref:hypothetical protein n=1 Tax=Actinomadura sp. KC06 TaxID=2530369 RepID=UPI001FB6F392|nr:hypothetical protein [Actinomadura sp. KC06]